MSVQLFKEEEVIYVDPLTLKRHLNAGWSFTKESKEETLDDLRERAKKAKIRSWHLLGEDKLKELLANEHEN